MLNFFVLKSKIENTLFHIQMAASVHALIEYLAPIDVLRARCCSCWIRQGTEFFPYLFQAICHKGMFNDIRDHLKRAILFAPHAPPLPRYIEFLKYIIARDRYEYNPHIRSFAVINGFNFTQWAYESGREFLIPFLSPISSSRSFLPHIRILEIIRSSCRFGNMTHATEFINRARNNRVAMEYIEVALMGSCTGGHARNVIILAHMYQGIKGTLINWTPYLPMIIKGGSEELFRYVMQTDVKIFAAGNLQRLLDKACKQKSPIFLEELERRFAKTTQDFWPMEFLACCRAGRLDCIHRMAHLAPGDEVEFEEVDFRNTLFAACKSGKCKVLQYVIDDSPVRLTASDINHMFGYAILSQNQKMIDTVLAMEVTDLLPAVNIICGNSDSLAMLKYIFRLQYQLYPGRFAKLEGRGSEYTTHTRIYTKLISQGRVGRIDDIQEISIYLYAYKLEAKSPPETGRNDGEDDHDHGHDHDHDQ